MGSRLSIPQALFSLAIFGKRKRQSNNILLSVFHVDLGATWWQQSCSSRKTKNVHLLHPTGKENLVSSEQEACESVWFIPEGWWGMRIWMRSCYRLHRHFFTGWIQDSPKISVHHLPFKCIEITLFQNKVQFCKPLQLSRKQNLHISKSMATYTYHIFLLSLYVTLHLHQSFYLYSRLDFFSSSIAKPRGKRQYTLKGIYLPLHSLWIQSATLCTCLFVGKCFYY